MVNFPATHRENTWCTTLLRKEFIRDLVPGVLLGAKHSFPSTNQDCRLPEGWHMAKKKPFC